MFFLPFSHTDSNCFSFLWAG